MRSKLSVIQFSNCIGHIFFPYKLHDTSAISVNISITYITCFTHVILQILPASTWRQSRDNHSVFRSPGWGAIAASGCSATSTPAAASACTAAASRKLDPQTVSIVIIAVATIHRVFRVSRVLELNEGEGWSSAAILEIDVADSAVFVEHVLNVLGSNVWR